MNYLGVPTNLLSAPARTYIDQLTTQLQSPPFASELLHFTLGFKYTSTLVSHDLYIAFTILRAALYLGLP